MAEYQVVAVARTPQSSGPPLLVELGLLPGNFDYETSLKTPDTFNQTVAIASLETSIKDRMRALQDLPLEVVVYRNDTKVFSGPVLALEVSSEEQTVTLTARSKLIYVAYMVLDTDQSYSGVEQYDIVVGFIDDWQSRTFGHFGIKTNIAGAASSGITRDWEVIGDDYENTLDVIYQIAGLDNGFDIWVDPTNDELMLASPRGSDLSGSVFIERGLQQSGAKITVAPEMMASEIYVTADDGTATASSTARRAAFGRTGKVIASPKGVSSKATAALAVFDSQLYIPGAAYIPMPESAVDTFDVGDYVSYRHDAGLGMVEGTFRVSKKKVTVMDNQESVEVQFV